MNLLQSADTRVFELLNGRLHNPALDSLMVALTTQSNWYPILAGLFVALLVWGGRRGRMAAGMLVLAVAATDRVVCGILKPLVCRERPSLGLLAGQVRLLVDRSEAFSFPSAHAANSFAMAAVVGWRFARFAPLAYAVAAIVAYSRIYVGVHYPFDVVAGVVVGLVVGRASVWAVIAGTRRWAERREAA